MLTVKNLTKSFEEKKVLKGITFELKEKESLVFWDNQVLANQCFYNA